MARISGRLMVATVVVMLAVGGCGQQRPHAASPPPNTPDDTSSDTGMGEPVAMAALDPAVDDAAQYLVKTLPTLDAVKASPEQLVLAVPQALDHDTGFPDGRMRSALTTLRGKLTASEAFTNSFVVIDATADQADQTLDRMQSDSSAFRDPLQRAPDQTHAAKYNPDSIYLLAGKFYQVTDRTTGEREYKLCFTVSNARLHRELARKEIDVRMAWDGQARQWRRAT
ncbi:hypothetical protein [Sphingomonas sp.]|uniref:hypothetical protein n=1 Tax=Sphingomonas sp. TaxID=28214 RepID=UPI003B00340F